MRAFYFSWALLLALAASAMGQQSGTADMRSYLIFLNGAPIGREDVTVRRELQGTTISSQARLGAPANITTRRAEVKYRGDWSPESLTLDASVNAVDLVLRTTFNRGTAVSEGRNGNQPVAATELIDADTFVLPNVFFAGYEALGRRLAESPAPSEIHAFVSPGAYVPFRIGSTTSEQMQTGTATFTVRRYELLFGSADNQFVMHLTTTMDGALVRLNLPAQALEVIREDAAASTARTQIYSNPGDEAVTIPAAGFNLGATLTRPRGTSLPARLPAVVLLGGSGVNDRDGYAAGVPVLGQLAGAIADAGFVAVRYDKRGYGQSGGRAESATLTDYAEDARTVVKWLADRNDIDPKRIAIIGHSEGAWVAMLAASKEKRIAALAAIAAPASTGADLVLEQQRHALEQSNAPAAERDEKIALQKKIQSAVLSGSGWEGVPVPLRRQADTPWFQSLLAYDPAAVIDDVRQPMLFVHGQLDRQVPVEHAERMVDLARRTSKSKSVEVVTVRGVNHLLVPATTGEVAEYATLTDRTISRDVTSSITAWLMKTFAAIR
jgi:pimeloyl-ACP methyl ester carboxylesterase